ncbi:MAG: HNH endonuclease [Desulfobacterales bacterium]|nr:HNH endonuclease [Desulfobacterales bacterium]
MSIKKIGEIKILYSEKENFTRKETVEVQLPENLKDVKDEINKKLQRYKKELRIKLGILTPKELHEIKNDYFKRFKYKKVYNNNLQKQAEMKSLLEEYKAELVAEEKKKNKGADKIFKYPKKVTKKIIHKNIFPYYVEMAGPFVGFDYEENVKFCIYDRSCFLNDYNQSPLEKYISDYKRGEKVGLIKLVPHPIDWDRDRERDWSKGNYYLYGNNIYNTNEKLPEDKLYLQILDLDDRERRKFERLKNKFAASEEEIKNRRERIPEKVRVAVWRRDEGKCVKCGSREKLEYDHIIPVSKGGGNTARNIELLCEKCNREKSNKI